MNVHDIAPGVVLDDGNVKEAFAVPHWGLEHSFGYRFDAADRSIVISGDTRASDAVVAACNGCDLLLHEVYSAERFKTRPEAWQRYHARAHTSTDELALLATRARPRQRAVPSVLLGHRRRRIARGVLRRAGYTASALGARPWDLLTC